VTDTDQTTEQASESSNGNDLEGLDDRTRQLVEAERERNRRAQNEVNSQAASYRHERNEAVERARRAEEEVQTLRRQHESEQERAIREAEERRDAEWQERLDGLTSEHVRQTVAMQVVAAAAGKLRDPQLAAKLIDVVPIAAESDEGKRDKLIADALEALLKANPYLSADASPPVVSQGGRSTPPGQGAERSWLRQPRR